MKTHFDPQTKRWLNRTADRLPRHDLFFGSPENRPTSGIPIGDGDTGSLLWLEKDGVHIHVNKCDLWQDAPPGVTWDDRCYCSGHEEELTCVKHAGEITIRLDSPAFEYLYQKAFSARLSLADATALLDCETPFCAVHARAFAESGVTALSFQIEAEEPEAPEIRLTRWGSRTLWRWYAMQKDAPETSLDGTEALADGKTLYITQELEPTKFCIALRLVTDEAVFTARKNRHAAAFTLPRAAAHRFTLFWTVKTGATTRDAKNACEQALDQAENTGEEALYRAHKAAWERFWEKSMLAIDDDYLENIWYLYLYYMNSESRGAYPPHFTSGLWGFYHDYIPWNYYFHYNEQHLYHPLDAAGHGELAKNYFALRKNGMESCRLFASIVKGKDGLFLHDVTDRFGRGAEYHHMNATPGAQVALHLWRHYRFTGDETFLRETVLPFMRGCVQYYLDLLEPGEDGLYHIHGTSAYESNETADDVLTDFTMIRALFPVYRPFAEAETKQRIDDALTHLPPPNVLPLEIGVDLDGETISFGVGKDRKPAGNAAVYGIAHKNGKPVRKALGNPNEPDRIEAFPDVELCSLYPSGLHGLKDKGSEPFDLLTNLLYIHRTGEETGHWNMLPIFLARMGMRGEVEKAARAMLSNFQGFPNGMNAEDGEPGDLRRNAPAFYRYDNTDTHEKCCIRSDDFIHFDFETEPIIAMALQESLLQSHEGVLRLCPANGALPVTFRLFAEGGFAVGAQFDEDGFVVTVESLRGEPCRIALPDEWMNRPLFAYLAPAGGRFAAIELPRVRFGREEVFEPEQMEKGSILLLSSEPLEALEPTPSVCSAPNRDMKVCGKAVLGSPNCMGNGKGQKC